ncbi:AraC family transcriptional regulator [Bacillus horti]|uniref:AraC-like DNA-binding protein/quercetin dioxygenase-like cupin family protein n=1 Tax=Caldalkalibacillus horti TaxID=77523 RepID=A0ABT9VVF8_9BACI|nr:AraC family transcriptional regulator [Bacillus horti]MDQ0164977.1 AraC-like DNA-binding protein/quercetin dioxygenase-like cupin family protein [Bacillus horti]
MNEKVNIDTPVAFRQVFVDRFDRVEEKRGRICHYQVAEEYGTGYLDRYTLHNGIQVTMLNIHLKETLVTSYDVAIPAFEVVYCLSGSMRHIEEEDGIFELKEGQYGIYIKNHFKGRLECLPNQTIKCISVVAFNPLSQLFSYQDDSNSSFIQDRLAGNRQKHVHFMQPRVIHPSLKIPFMEIDRCRLSSIPKLIYLESKASEIISTSLEKVIQEKNESHTKVFLSQHDKQQLALAEEIIINRLADPLSIPQLAKAVNLNTHKLKEGFKSMYGQTVFSYIKEARIEKARELLLEREDLSIYDIVIEVGYSSTGHFAKAFREKLGTTPRDYRLQSLALKNTN